MRWSLHQCEPSRTMDFLVILVLALYITQAFTKSKSKKSKASESEEGSIENLLYFKDCQRNAKPEPVVQPMPLRYELPPTTTPPPRQPECLFPKMCCALTCGNECGGTQSSISRMQPETPMIPPQFQPPANAAANIRRGRLDPVRPRRRKKIRPPNMSPLLPSRRDGNGGFSGFTKEKIKGLIAKDDDIRKILKDLVRVTMQKVDLQDMINGNQNSYNGGNTVRSVTSTTADDIYMDDYVE